MNLTYRHEYKNLIDSATGKTIVVEIPVFNSYFRDYCIKRKPRKTDLRPNSERPGLCRYSTSLEF